MAQRFDLQTLLEATLGSEEVFFQAPPNTKMEYPAIVYGLGFADTKFANNVPYSFEKRYQITVMDRDPDSVIRDRVALLPKCLFVRHFIKDNLNHYIFNIYF
jgi:hypothetical protein